MLICSINTIFSLIPIQWHSQSSDAGDEISHSVQVHQVSELVSLGPNVFGFHAVVQTVR